MYDIKNNPPTIEVVYNSPTLKTKFLPDREITKKLQSIQLSDDDIKQHLLVDTDETVGSLSALELVTVINEQKNSFNVTTGEKMDELPWFSQLKQLDILVGDSEDNVVRVGVTSYSDEGNKSYLM